MKDESTIQQEVQIAAMHFNCHLMRNNSGSLVDKDNRPVRFGLGNVSAAHNKKIKSSDLIGFTKIKITPEMVGKEIAVFTAIEVKKEGWSKNNSNLDDREEAQYAFISWIRKNGGFADFIDSVDKLKNIFRY